MILPCRRRFLRVAAAMLFLSWGSWTAASDRNSTLIADAISSQVPATGS